MVELPSNAQDKDAEKIKGLFSSISSTYDRANDVITFGMARRWRRKLVELSGAQPGHKVLDCATGTGDLALEFKLRVGPTGSVVGSDFCQEMLALAPEKAKSQGLQVSFELADVLNLQYETDSFDISSIAYGVRNVEDPIKAIQEMARVTRPGGSVMILETGNSKSPLLGPCIEFYCTKLMPRLGAWVSGDRQAYEYLNESSSIFPSKEEFIQQLEATQVFSKVEFTSLMGGASFIYQGTVSG